MVAQRFGRCGLVSSLLRLSVFFLFVSPFASAQFFQPETAHETWTVGDVIEIPYHTTMRNYTIALWKEAKPGNKQGRAILGPVLVRKCHGPYALFHWASCAVSDPTRPRNRKRAAYRVQMASPAVRLRPQNLQCLFLLVKAWGTRQPKEHGCNGHHVVALLQDQEERCPGRPTQNFDSLSHNHQHAGGRPHGAVIVAANN